MAAAKARARGSTTGRRRRDSAGRASRNSLFDKAGITVTETSSEASTATEIATAMSRNNCPASSSMIRIGTNTSTVVRAETITADHTWRVPW